MSGTLLPVLEKQLRFAVLGDFGVRGTAPEAVASMIRSWEPDFIITTGDNTYGPVDHADILPAEAGMQTGWDEFVGRYYGEFISGATTGVIIR
jgi:hypothetical protein